MRRVTIIGAGMAGLRAALEFVTSGDWEVVMVEKSSSVGGRVATRRLIGSLVNHGAESFHGMARVQQLDPLAREWDLREVFPGAATELPKRMRDRLLLHPARFRLRTGWAARAVEGGTVTGPEGESIAADVVLITAPVPQAELLLHREIPGVRYAKAVLFIGEQDGQAVRREMDEAWSETHFELSDDVLLAAGAASESLAVKKWRYARVRAGLAKWFLALDQKTIVAGDAFDPHGVYDLSASWLSGLQAARYIMEKNDE
jgi:predicted NAD/FAD-dependent oxidoreductase